MIIYIHIDAETSNFILGGIVVFLFILLFCKMIDDQ